MIYYELKVALEKTTKLRLTIHFKDDKEKIIYNIKSLIQK